MKNVKNPHAPQICFQPPRFRSLLGNGASGKVGLSEKMYLNELILIQASPSMRLVPLFLFVFLTGARAMWEGETWDVFGKLGLKIVQFAVESDSYGIAFQRNGIINDHR